MCFHSYTLKLTWRMLASPKHVSEESLGPIGDREGTQGDCLTHARDATRVPCGGRAWAGGSPSGSPRALRLWAGTGGPLRQSNLIFIVKLRGLSVIRNTFLKFSRSEDSFLVQELT